MIRFCLLLLFFSASHVPALSQKLTGNVIDALDKAYIDKVLVVNLSNNDSTITNERGYFRVSGVSGDSLHFSKDNYIPNTILVGEQTHFVTQIYFNARLLPTFDVYANEFRIPFQVGNVSGMKSLGNRPTGPGKIYTGLANNPSLQPGLTLDGPFSYFMKSERHKREYAKKLDILSRKKDYLEVIQSDSVMTALKETFLLGDRELDSLIVAFNLENQYHQFLDMNRVQVEKLLLEFFQIHAYRKKY
ncbi:hypothetical protein [Rhodonellum sp.]|uniref:hypothetical protein n=1 Tax=Rhodonellum sp. TaxID=2231180 RepID=UPI0027196002|nr:hypothetical protein [Rhodonellum sp.]MDO9552821.1 hypothetical protein [Rhodonellum sp.]